MTPDWKQGKRVVATREEWAALRERKLGPCRVCRRVTPFVTLHHLVSRSLYGSDTAHNLVPLCGHGTTGCHGLVESWDETACLKLGLSLTPDELGYVLAAKGSDFLARRYKIVVSIGNTYVTGVAA